MNRTTCIFAVLLVSGIAIAGEAPHWEYAGEAGPEHWSTLSSEFSACSGKNQSPIDLKGFVEAELKPIEFHYQGGVTDIVNNGHTVQVNAAPGSAIGVDGVSFALKQFHFHAPSENMIDGKSFPLEAHLVHADADGNLAVIAVLFDEGEASKALAGPWSQMPGHGGEHATLNAPVAPLALLPSNRDYYRFNGSLTTPPCTEGVRWLVMKDAATASAEQIEQFTHVLHHPNNRPVQPVNARPVLQ